MLSLQLIQISFQFPLSELGSLQSDIMSPTDYIQCLSVGDLWAANKGVIAALHQERYDSMFSVISGTLKVTLIPNWIFSELYPRKMSAEALLTSEIEDINDHRVTSKYPEMQSALKESLNLTLKAGETLFVPSFTWVQMEWVDVGFSVSHLGWVDEMSSNAVCSVLLAEHTWKHVLVCLEDGKGQWAEACAKRIIALGRHPTRGLFSGHPVSILVGHNHPMTDIHLKHGSWSVFADKLSHSTFQLLRMHKPTANDWKTRTAPSHPVLLTGE
jgi:hypothetical protein